MQHLGSHFQHFAETVLGNAFHVDLAWPENKLFYSIEPTQVRELSMIVHGIGVGGGGGS